MRSCKVVKSRTIFTYKLPVYLYVLDTCTRKLLEAIHTEETWQNGSTYRIHAIIFISELVSALELKHDLPLCVVDFVVDAKGVSLLEAYDKWRDWADKKVCCDYGLHVGVTWWSAQVSQEMETLVKEKGKINFQCTQG